MKSLYQSDLIPKNTPSDQWGAGDFLRRKSVAFQISSEDSGDESLASKRGTKCTRNAGFCNFAVFVHEKSM
jgi:hypothetical protein